MNNKKGPLIVLLFVGVIGVVVIIALLASKYLKGTTGGTPSGTIEINYIGLWDEKEIYEPLIKEYQDAHPNIKISYTKASFNNQNNLTYKGVYQTSAEERIANGSVDIIRVHQTWIAKLLPQLYGAPADVMTGAQAKELYYTPVYQAITSSNGVVFGAPQMVDGLVLFYNKTVFADAKITDPKTATKDWDVTLITAKALTQKNSNGTMKLAGINMGSVANVRSSPEILLAMLTQAAIPIVGVDAATAKVSASFASDEGAATINRFYEFSKLKTWSSLMENDVEAFASGRLAMLISPSWRAINLIEMNPKLQFDTLPLPVLPGANPEVPQYLSSFWVDVVSKKAKYPKESWAFLKWLGEPAQLRKIYKIQLEKKPMGIAFPRKDMAGEQSTAPYIAAVVEMAPTMKSWPLYDYGVWEETFRKGLLEFEDKGGVTTADLQTIQTQINSLTLKR